MLDDYGKTDNNMVLLVAGTIIGLVLILFVIPLAVDAVATQQVSNVADNVLTDTDTSYDTSVAGNTGLPTGNTQASSPNNVEEGKDTSSSSSSGSSGTDYSGMYIHSGSITTGSSLESRSSCTVYVGSQFAGKEVQISTLYSRDDSNLNQGKIVSTTVDTSGYVTVKAADSYSLYPDHCYIELLDPSGNILDSRDVLLETRSGTQSF